MLFKRSDLALAIYLNWEIVNGPTMQGKNCTKLKPSPRITIYYHVAFSPDSLIMIYYMTVQRLDGEWEGLGAVLTRSLHDLDSILISVLLGW